MEDVDNYFVKGEDSYPTEVIGAYSLIIDYILKWLISAMVDVILNRVTYFSTKGTYTFLEI